MVRFVWRSLNRSLGRSVARSVGQSLPWSLDHTVALERSNVTEFIIQREGLHIIFGSNGTVQTETCIIAFSTSAYWGCHMNVSAWNARMLTERP